MNKGEIYAVLQQKVEMVAGRNMNTPRDFDYLSTLIFDRTKSYIAPITLKRFWGYLGERYRKNHTVAHLTFLRYMWDIPVLNPLRTACWAWKL